MWFKDPITAAQNDLWKPSKWNFKAAKNDWRHQNIEILGTFSWHVALFILRCRKSPMHPSQWRMWVKDVLAHAELAEVFYSRVLKFSIRETHHLFHHHWRSQYQHQHYVSQPCYFLWFSCFRAIRGTGFERLAFFLPMRSWTHQAKLKNS